MNIGVPTCQMSIGVLPLCNVLVKQGSRVKDRLIYANNGELFCYYRIQTRLKKSIGDTEQTAYIIVQICKVGLTKQKA